MGRNNREKIYNLLSPRILERKSRRAALSSVTRLEAPVVVNNAEVCVPEVAKPNNIKVELPEPLVISPNEGKPAVNGQAEKLDIRPLGVKKEVDPGIAAIPAPERKKGGRPKKKPE